MEIEQDMAVHNPVNKNIRLYIEYNQHLYIFAI